MARELGFARITANSLDAVGRPRFRAGLSLRASRAIATHLSRLAEDFVLFASQEFGFVMLPDEYSTGSSLMPQKKNPDVWELAARQDRPHCRRISVAVRDAKGTAVELSARFAGRQGTSLRGTRPSLGNRSNRGWGRRGDSSQRGRFSLQLRIQPCLQPRQRITWCAGACLSAKRTKSWAALFVKRNAAANPGRPFHWRSSKASRLCSNPISARP